MRELALHLLDLVQNALTAGATHLRIEIRLDSTCDCLRMEIGDDGRGIPPEMVTRVTDPFVTSRTTRHVGLGLPLLKAAAERCDGSLTLASVPGHGTIVTAVFRLGHVDRMPLGDVAGTIVGLVACNPDLELAFQACWDDARFDFLTADWRRVLSGEVSMAQPAVLAYLRDYLANGLAGLRHADEAAMGLSWRETPAGGASLT